MFANWETGNGRRLDPSSCTWNLEVQIAYMASLIFLSFSTSVHALPQITDNEICGDNCTYCPKLNVRIGPPDVFLGNYSALQFVCTVSPACIWVTLPVSKTFSMVAGFILFLLPLFLHLPFF